VVVLTCFVMCGCVYVWVLCVWMCVCMGFVTCGYFDNYVDVSIICELVFTVFCIVCTVFLYCFVYVQGGAKRTHVFQITVTLFIFNIKKLCQHQNNL